MEAYNDLHELHLHLKNTILTKLCKEGYAI